MSLIISNEQLISEIRKRPMLFDKNLDDYNDRKLRLKLWNQICQVVIPKWNELSMTERLLRRKEVQSRWKNLRSCFWRDYNFQKNEKLLGKPNRKRRWLFFNRLSFLLTPEQKLLISHNKDKNDCDPLDDDNNDDDINNIQDNDDCMDGLSNTTVTPTSLTPPLILPTTTTITTEEMTKKSELYDELLGIVKEKNTNEREQDDGKVDEERMFLLSLLPQLKKFNDEQKFVAKIEILDLMRRIQLFQFTTIASSHNYCNLITQPPSSSSSNNLEDNVQNQTEIDSVKIENM